MLRAGRTTAVFCAVAALLAAATACDSNSSAKNASSAKYHVTYVTAFGAAGRDAFVWVAEQKGYFRQAGLDVGIELGKATGKHPLQAIREHLGLSREAVASIVKFDPKCLAICEDHAGVAMPDNRFRQALARCLGVPAELLFEPTHRAV